MDIFSNLILGTDGGISVFISKHSEYTLYGELVRISLLELKVHKYRHTTVGGKVRDYVDNF